MTTFNTKVSKRQYNVGGDRVSTSSSADIRENSVCCNCENGYISDFSDVQKISNRSTKAARHAGLKNIRNSALMETSGNCKGSDLKYHKPTKHVRTGRKQFVLTTQSKHVSGNEIALVSSKTRKSRSSAEDDIDGPTESKRQKCTTKNAVIARMNRLKKKRYVENLECKVSYLTEENSELKKTAEENSSVISTLSKEVKYLKSVLANSKDISMLLKCVRHNTGLTTYIPSLRESPSDADSKLLNGECNDLIESDEFLESAEPSSNVAFQSPFVDDYLPSIDPLCMSNDAFLGFQPSSNDILEVPHPESPSQSSVSEDLQTNVGVCLHIAKHRVSLEFCPSCNDNSISAWEKNTIY